MTVPGPHTTASMFFGGHPLAYIYTHTRWQDFHECTRGKTSYLKDIWHETTNPLACMITFFLSISVFFFCWLRFRIKRKLNGGSWELFCNLTEEKWKTEISKGKLTLIVAWSYTQNNIRNSSSISIWTKPCSFPIS